MTNTDTRTISNRANVVLWLFAGCFLIFLMVIVGGITRLTGSGLSITEWKVVTGTLPPLNENQWLTEFHKYMDSPQFRLINSHFGLEEFKEIYWWEYIHRLLGRVIGIVFIVPFVWFLVTRQLSKSMIWKSMVLFAMGGLQGFLGWYMVKSGLVEQPSVSHLRLAMHLSTAFATFGLTFWFALGLLDTGRIPAGHASSAFRIPVIATFIVLVIQIVYGAFVAGLKAGLVYNTWPLMEGSFMPPSVSYAFGNDGWASLRDNMASVQFIHRTIAILLVAAICYLLWKAMRTAGITRQQSNAFRLVAAAAGVQFVLGIFTLLYAVPVALGVIHQAGAFLLLSCMIYLIHSLYRQPASELS